MRIYGFISQLIVIVLFLSPVIGFSQQAIIEYDGPLTDGDFKALFKPMNGSEYKVREDIRFTIKANQNFYLHLFAMDDKGKPLPVLPTLKAEPRIYQAGVEYMVPDSDIHFKAGCSGIQRVVMVATTKPVTEEKAQGMALAISTKGAFLREKKGSEITSEIALNITGDPITPTTVSVGQDRYRLNEYIPVTFSAPKDGFIYIWIKNPENATDFLARRPVYANKLLSLRLKAVPPVGHHTIIALYDEKGEIDEKNASLEAAGYGDCPGSKKFGVFHLEVQE